MMVWLGIIGVLVLFGNHQRFIDYFEAKKKEKLGDKEESQNEKNEKNNKLRRKKRRRNRKGHRTNWPALRIDLGSYLELKWLR